jgi:TfoX/Sxy family transcriptional regulator of competence genes
MQYCAKFLAELCNFVKTKKSGKTLTLEVYCTPSKYKDVYKTLKSLLQLAPIFNLIKLNETSWAWHVGCMG